MARGLTVRQQKFAIFLMDAANGNQTLAAKMAGYKGDNRQLAVQGSVNMKNSQVQQMIRERLEGMLEPSLRAFEEGLNATKRRAFMTKTGEIRYTDPEPDHRVRTTTGDRVLDRYQRTCTGYADDFDVDVVSAHENGAEPPKAEADGARTEGCADAAGTDVAQLNQADRVLSECVATIDAGLAEIDRALADHDGGHVADHHADHEVEQRSSNMPVSMEPELAEIDHQLADHHGDEGTDDHVGQRSSTMPVSMEAESSKTDREPADPDGDHGTNHEVEQRSSTTPVSIEAKAAETDPELADHHGGHGADHEVEQGSSTPPVCMEAKPAKADHELADPGGDRGTNE